MSHVVGEKYKCERIQKKRTKRLRIRFCAGRHWLRRGQGEKNNFYRSLRVARAMTAKAMESSQNRTTTCGSDQPTR